MGISGAGRKLTALWHVKNLVGVNVLHFEILGGIVDEMVAGQVKFRRDLDNHQIRKCCVRSAKGAKRKRSAWWVPKILTLWLDMWLML